MQTLRDQLKDPIFRKWFAKSPTINPNAAISPPWYLYIQEKQGGPWKRAEFRDYKKAYKHVAKNIKSYHDMALSNKRQEYQPPVVRTKSGKRKYHIPEAPGHIWCTFCRRMTRFTYFRKHHAMPGWSNEEDRRCSICGVRLKFIKRYD